MSEQTTPTVLITLDDIDAAVAQAQAERAEAMRKMLLGLPARLACLAASLRPARARTA